MSCARVPRDARLRRRDDPAFVPGARSVADRFVVAAALLPLSGCSDWATLSTRDKVIRGALAGAAFGTAVGCTEGVFIHEHKLTVDALGCGAGLIAGAAVGAALAPYVVFPQPVVPPLSDKEKLMLSGGGPFSGRSARSTPQTRPPQEKLTLRGVHFGYNQSSIRPEDEPLLDEAADTLRAHPNVTIYVDGYTDARGTDDYNKKLSQQRAEAVARYLVKAGIEAGRVIPRGLGKTNFLATNDTEDGRAQNRRVELVPSG